MTQPQKITSIENIVCLFVCSIRFLFWDHIRLFEIYKKSMMSRILIATSEPLNKISQFLVQNFCNLNHNSTYKYNETVYLIATKKNRDIFCHSVSFMFTITKNETIKSKRTKFHICTKRIRYTRTYNILNECCFIASSRANSYC